MEHPRLRDSKRLQTSEPYPMNELPEDLIVRIGGYLVHLLYIGRKDITGTDWGDAFADAVGGEHLDSPCGIADVVLDKMAWSMKTVKNARPFSMETVRLISGRCSPDYSYGITDPHEDIQRTGRAVLGIWNERINIAQDYYNPVRAPPCSSVPTICFPIVCLRKTTTVLPPVTTCGRSTPTEIS